MEIINPADVDLVVGQPQPVSPGREGTHVPDDPQRRRLWYERSILLAGLAAMLVAMLATRSVGLHGRALHVSIALAIASLSWLVWVLVGPRGDTPVLFALTACTALSGSVLLLMYPSLAVYWFTFWACFNAGASFGTRPGALITTSSAIVLVAGFVTHRGTVLAAFAAVAFVGHVLGRSRRKYIGLASQATAAAQDREREATLAERGRIARELHDVLGHSLTGVSMQIESAAAVLETTADAARALSYLDNAGRLVRTGQQEAVAAVRTVREGEVGLEAMLQALVDVHRDAGATVRYSVTGSPRPLGAACAMALYRVAQEALTNAAKHACGQPVEVALVYSADTVSVRVVNSTGAAASGAVSGGQGVPGMRERMAAVGGTANARRVGSEWHVEAQVTA